MFDVSRPRIRGTKSTEIDNVMGKKSHFLTCELVDAEAKHLQLAESSQRLRDGPWTALAVPMF